MHPTGIGFYGAINRVIAGGIAGEKQVKSGFPRYKFNTSFFFFYLSKDWAVSH